MAKKETASHILIAFPVSILAQGGSLDARDISGISKRLADILPRFAGSVKVSEPKQGIGDIQTVRFTSAIGSMDIDFYSTDAAVSHILETVHTQAPDIFSNGVIDAMVVMSVPKKIPIDMLDVRFAIEKTAKTETDRCRILFAADNASPGNLVFYGVWGEASITLDVLQNNIREGKAPLYWDTAERINLNA